MTSENAAGTSVIHDIGYKPYTGPRLGHRSIVRALYVHSLRSVFGLGRGTWAKVVPVGVLAIMLLPAALNVYASSVGHVLVLTYTHMAHSTSLFAVVFVAVAAPELVSRDLRHHTLPLYFSRPLRRADYPIAKLLALATGVLVIEVLPLLITYLGQVASSNSGSAVWSATKAVTPALLVAVMYAAAFSSFSLLIASTTGRRVIATGVIAILFIATSAISAVLESAGTTYGTSAVICEQTGEPLDVGPCPGRIIKVEADPSYSTLARGGGLVDPIRLIEGTRIWALDATDGAIPDPNPLGPVYAAELAVLVAAVCGGLLLRYRRVSVS